MQDLLWREMKKGSMKSKSYCNNSSFAFMVFCFYDVGNARFFSFSEGQYNRGTQLLAYTVIVHRIQE